MSVPDDLAALLTDLEFRLMDPSIRRSRETLSEQLADDFLEFGRSGGIYDKRTVIEALAAEHASGAVHKWSIQDLAVRELGGGSVLVTCRSVRRRLPDAEPQHTLRSSVWSHDGGRWRMRFHQGTPALGKSA